MAVKFNLMPNESIILQEVSVAHGGVWAIYTDELILTNLNIYCVNKGTFGNTKKIFNYPLSQIKKYNGKPQVMMGKLSNGTPSLDIYFMNGSSESFNFQSGNKKNINKWIDAINNIVGGGSDSNNLSMDDDSYDDDDDSDTLVGAFKEVGSEFKEVGVEFLGALGFKPGKKKSPNSSVAGSETVSKKCSSCSAPLIGKKGQVIKCKYCDTKQTL